MILTQVLYTCYGFLVKIDDVSIFESDKSIVERLSLRLHALTQDLAWIPGFEDERYQKCLEGLIQQGASIHVSDCSMSSAECLKIAGLSDTPDCFVGVKLYGDKVLNNSEEAFEVLRALLLEMSDIKKVSKRLIVHKIYSEWSSL